MWRVLDGWGEGERETDCPDHRMHLCKRQEPRPLSSQPDSLYHCLSLANRQHDSALTGNTHTHVSAHSLCPLTDRGILQTHPFSCWNGDTYLHEVAAVHMTKECSPSFKSKASVISRERMYTPTTWSLARMGHHPTASRRPSREGW